MDRDPVGVPVTVAIIEDQPVVVEGVRSWIARDAEARVTVVDSGDSIDAVLAGPGCEADVLLLDLNLNGVFVVDRVAELAAAGHRIVVFSQHDESATVLEVLNAGAAQFVTKAEAREHCVEAIVAAAGDRPYVTRSVAGAMVTDASEQRPVLSQQERTALLLWFQGMKKESVAQRMGITENTVRQYINRARLKYARVERPAPTKAALLARAIQDGLLRVDEVGDYRSFGLAPESRKDM